MTNPAKRPQPGTPLAFADADPGKLVTFTHMLTKLTGIIAGRTPEGKAIIHGGGEALVVAAEEYDALDVRNA